MKETLDVNPEYPSIPSGDAEIIGLGISPPEWEQVKSPVEVENSTEVENVSNL